METHQLNQPGKPWFVPGFASIIAFIAMRNPIGSAGAESLARGRSFVIFVGFWAQTLFILSKSINGHATKPA